ncbi:hypothetical protein Pst134EA_031278 [Puccinia striiformis f. sp. tritici]|uniref:uncharacterized protein n=1 Tax=Puccinia striiformis f. sp. tritici TaxID=168172 RepID=UPI002008941C|nr:uncharacterized protein Pst134EA_031278 [Puccinia striiformis f. sp. tritici]KAH9443402.1 hypothetical protein Pst134EA_031278 [Puccinia striiformis f. sp. tritici]
MNLYILLILLAVGSDYSLGAVGETSREISSQVVSDGHCIHEPPSNQIDRDIIEPLDSDGQRLSSSRASVSRVGPSARLHFATSSIVNKKEQPDHHQVIDIKDPSTTVSGKAQEYKQCAYCGTDLELPKETPNLHYCAKCENHLRLIWAKQRLTEDGRCKLCQGEGKTSSAQSASVNQLRSSDFRRTSPAGTQDRIPARQGRSAVVRNDQGSSSAVAQVHSQNVETSPCSRFVLSASAVIMLGCIWIVVLLRKRGIY